ncbi:AraC family transcriptional regulator [Pseudomonas aeruginosa]|nr:AraC family transcriptional regulator [Pseudomonas aeruginosa]
MERIEAYFAGHGYDPHRHDTYAIGQTLAGVQSFRYRHSQRHSLPGGCLVLHPDELHDGEAGSQEGFRYRMLYVEPALIQQALGGRPLPFVRGGLSADLRLAAASRALLQAMDTPLEPLEEQDALFELAHALDAVAGNRARGRRHFDFVAAERARQYIHAHLEHPLSLDELAQVAQRERWSLSRDFRALFGTSPYRYLVQRRLDIARRLMLGGQSLAEAALAAGFVDQSHMTPPFRPELRPAAGTLAAHARRRLGRLHDHPRPPAAQSPTLAPSHPPEPTDEHPATDQFRRQSSPSSTTAGSPGWSPR